MIRIRDVLRRLRGDAGMGLVEVVVAMMIFAIASIGIAYAATAAVTLSRDAASRETAAKLAAQEIDKIRGIQNPFQVFTQLPATSTTTIGSVTYTTSYGDQPVTTTGTVTGCSAGAGAYLYTIFTVTVTWTGKLSATLPAVASTALAPLTHVTTAGDGTLYASVIGSAGIGISGVTVTATPTSGGAAVTMSTTDPSGCSYGFNVAPGTYTVAISKSGYISSTQLASPQVLGMTVTSSSATTASFAYDQAATYNLSYAYTVPSGSTAVLPTNLDLDFSNSNGDFLATGVGMEASAQGYPFSTGYVGIAGAYQPANTASACLAPDPASWPASEVLNQGARSAAVAATPGGTASMTIPMGSVTFTASKGTYTASATTPSGGAPTCATPPTYTFTSTVAGSITVPLPYGTWTIKKGSTTLSSPTLISAQAGTNSNTAISGSTIVLDPRTHV